MQWGVRPGRQTPAKVLTSLTICPAAHWDAVRRRAADLQQMAVENLVEKLWITPANRAVIVENSVENPVENRGGGPARPMALPLVLRLLLGLLLELRLGLLLELRLGLLLALLLQLPL